MIKKSLKSLINLLLDKQLRTEFPMFKKFIEVYLEYLDSNSYSKIANITLNNDPSTMYPELLDNYFNQFFHDMIDIEKYGLTDENKRLYIEISKLLTGLNGTRKSTEFLFHALDDFEVFNVGTIPHVNDYVYSVEPDRWNFAGFKRKYPFEYRFLTGAEMPTETLSDIIKNIHPAGYNFDFLTNINQTDSLAVEDNLHLNAATVFLYNGTKKYDGTHKYGEEIEFINEDVAVGLIPTNGIYQLMLCISYGQLNGHDRFIDAIAFGTSVTPPDSGFTIGSVGYYHTIDSRTVTDATVTFNWSLPNTLYNGNSFYTFALIDGEETNVVAARYIPTPIDNDENTIISGSHSITFVRLAG